MTEQSNQSILVEEILAKSVSKIWGYAITEWSLSSIYLAATPQTCLCGHTPIKEVCIIINSQNGNTAEVGNVCVNRFLGIDSESIFNGINRVITNPEAGLNKAASEYAYKKGWINEWEFKFSLETNKKRQLTPKMSAKRAQINKRVINKVAKR